MLDDEDAKAKPARLRPLALHALGVSELQAYITELQAEIARVEAEIARKRSHRSAADAVFKPG